MKLGEIGSSVSMWARRLGEKSPVLMVVFVEASIAIGLVVGFSATSSEKPKAHFIVAACLIWLGVHVLVSYLYFESQRRRSQSAQFVRLYEGLRRYTIGNIEPLINSVNELSEGKRIAMPAEADIQTDDSIMRDVQTKERNVLLTIIGVLCKAQDIDISRAAKAAGTIKHLCELHGVQLGETTIEQHLKRARTAMDSRMK